jgi:hypothetical protein
VEQSRAWWVLADRAYDTILPGHTLRVGVTCLRKRAGGLLSRDCADPRRAAPEPVVGFRAFTAPLPT